MTCRSDEIDCLNIADELACLLESHPVLPCDPCTCSLADTVQGNATVGLQGPCRPGKDFERVRSHYARAAEMVRRDAISIVLSLCIPCLPIQLITHRIQQMMRADPILVSSICTLTLV